MHFLCFNIFVILRIDFQQLLLKLYGRASAAETESFISLRLIEIEERRGITKEAEAYLSLD